MSIIQKAKSELWYVKVANWLCEYPSFKKDVFFKAFIKAFKEIFKDKISESNEECNLIYKQLDEINEQLDENQQKFKNTLGEIVEETNLFLKKLDEYEYEEGEKMWKS